MESFALYIRSIELHKNIKFHRFLKSFLFIFIIGHLNQILGLFDNFVRYNKIFVFNYLITHHFESIIRTNINLILSIEIINQYYSPS